MIAPAPSQPAVEFAGVSFRYDGPWALQEVDLAIPRGDFAGCVGPNGGGKSTLLRLALGLLAPTRGQVRVLGMPPAQARQRIGYLPQHNRLDAQFPASALEVVLMGRLGPKPQWGPFGREARRLAHEALRDVNMADLHARPFAALSGGQQKRVLLARALVCRPELLLLDEPAANLDIEAERQLYDLLRKLNERLTIVVVSHDMGFVSRHVRTAVCVNRMVHTHASSELSDEVIRRLYGREMRLVEHHPEPGHTHGPDCHHETIDAERK
jgi:zinc transport system ATP-binding protein